MSDTNVRCPANHRAAGPRRSTNHKTIRGKGKIKMATEKISDNFLKYN